MSINRTLIFYETPSGSCPVEKFMRKLPALAREKTLAALRSVQEDNPVSPVLFCKMTSADDLWEVRVKSRGDIYRLLCFIDGSRLVVAALGFQKKSQKTPKQYIRTAVERKKDYFRRKQ